MIRSSPVCARAGCASAANRATNNKTVKRRGIFRPPVKRPRMRLGTRGATSTASPRAAPWSIVIKVVGVEEVTIPAAHAHAGADIVAPIHLLDLTLEHFARARIIDHFELAQPANGFDLGLAWAGFDLDRIVSFGLQPCDMVIHDRARQRRDRCDCRNT